jgi:hypothetical protein
MMITLIATILKKLATVCRHIFKERLENMPIGHKDTLCFLLPPSLDERGSNPTRCHKTTILWIPAGMAIVGKVNAFPNPCPEWEKPPPLQVKPS